MEQTKEELKVKILHDLKRVAEALDKLYEDVKDVLEKEDN